MWLEEQAYVHTSITRRSDPRQCVAVTWRRHLLAWSWQSRWRRRCIDIAMPICNTENSGLVNKVWMFSFNWCITDQNAVTQGITKVCNILIIKFLYLRTDRCMIKVICKTCLLGGSSTNLSNSPFITLMDTTYSQLIFLTTALRSPTVPSLYIFIVAVEYGWLLKQYSGLRSISLCETVFIQKSRQL